jgi:hypothetical protein
MNLKGNQHNIYIGSKIPQLYGWRLFSFRWLGCVPSVLWLGTDREEGIDDNTILLTNSTI